ncbi:hypothetical protein CAEBREN_13917 [Caenorhabditis brenneri]|uniref:Uncharacterized protein n=1 Tax=Caenorhabditis brenneri TaxID=135651 RepID=G0N4Z3_CAEBE|nr:hypothetical protein CAEBREN_13917 [Caenorhabditis brenneri]
MHIQTRGGRGLLGFKLIDNLKNVEVVVDPECTNFKYKFKSNLNIRKSIEESVAELPEPDLIFINWLRYL